MNGDALQVTLAGPRLVILRLHDIDDPRVWAAAAAPAAARLHALVRASFGAATRRDGDRHDSTLRAALADLLREDDGARLAAVFASAPDAAVYRHLWRALTEVEAQTGTGAVRTTVFALPVVIVGGVEGDGRAALALPGVLADAPSAAALLRAHGALSGNQTFALSPALVAADALDLPRLPRLLARGALPERADALPGAPPDFPPEPIELAPGHESVHLRFIVGVALCAPDVDLLAASDEAKWGLPLARALGEQLAAPGTTVLALPHAPQRLLMALQTGRALQREVSAQMFLSNALRRMRASTGEPAAVISAHRVPDAPAGGELRLSLSSPFGPRDAEGFRCPLYAVDRSADVVQMLTALLRDFRVAELRVLPGVHADRDAATGVPLLFRADALH